MRQSALVVGCLSAVMQLTAQSGAPGDVTQERQLRVYVGSVNGPEEELAHHVRARLVDELLAQGVALVESEENADAILTGERVQESTKSLRLGRRTAVCIRGELRLVARRGALLWKGDVSSDRYAVSHTASFAQNAGRGIVQALDAEARRGGLTRAGRQPFGPAMDNWSYRLSGRSNHIRPRP